MKILFDSKDYENSIDSSIMIEDIEYVLEDKVRKIRGEVVGFVFKSKRESRYGSICNNGQMGYSIKMVSDLKRAILNIKFDEIVIWDNEGELLVCYYDHDGSHNCTIHPITKSKLQTVKNKEHNFNKMLNYIETMTTMKTKK